MDPPARRLVQHGLVLPRQRQVLTLKVYEQLKFVEIAGIAGISIGTAKATFFQAVQALRARLLGERPGRRRSGAMTAEEGGR